MSDPVQNTPLATSTAAAPVAPAPPVSDPLLLSRTPVTLGVVGIIVSVLCTAACLAVAALWSRLTWVEGRVIDKIEASERRLDARFGAQQERLLSVLDERSDKFGAKTDARIDRVIDQVAAARETSAALSAKLDALTAAVERINGKLDAPMRR